MKLYGWILLLIVAVAAGAGGYYLGQHAAPEKAEKAEKPDADEATTKPADEDEVKAVVGVRIEPLRRQKITRTVTAYGTVVAEAGEVRSVSVPFESRVVRVLVTPGQPVEKGAEVVEVEASPDALVALAEARNGLDAAARDLQQTQARFNEHLATNQDLSQAQQALASARLKLSSLQQRGVGESHRLKAEAAGIVSKVDVQEGAIVAAGAPLVELAAGNRIEVRLGVEPSDASSLKLGQPVCLYRVDRAAGESIEGKVRMIEQRVDPATRLVEVRVALPANTPLLLDSFIAGQFPQAVADALVVPRDAALPDEEGKFAVYTVQGDHAVKHLVRLGIENDRDVQVLADDLKADDPVVIEGNYLLENGRQVVIKEPSSEPASEPAPASSQPAAQENKS